MTVHVRAHEPADCGPTHRVFESAIHGTAAERYSADQIQAWCPAEYDQTAWGRARARAWTVVGELDGEGWARVTTKASRAALPAFERFGFVVDRANPDNVIRGVAVPNFSMHIDLV